MLGAAAATQSWGDAGRWRLRTHFACAGLLLVALYLLPLAFAAPTYPELTGRIVDNANLLTPEDRAAIEADLAALEQTSTDQLAIATVPSLEGYAIEDYSIGLSRKWALGQKGKDNGILLLIAPNERKVRIEVGRRLEPMMNDTMTTLIIQNAILPKFRRGDFSGGVRDGVRDIKAVILGDAEEVKQRSKVGRTPDDYSFIIHLVIFFAIFALILYLNSRAAHDTQQTIGPDGRRRRGRRRGNVVVIPGGSSDWGGSWSGGGGGGGGWSGGGGGFGGGGASGSW